MKEDARERSSKYVETTLDSLKRLKRKNIPGSVATAQVNRVLELVNGYVADASHYMDEKPITSLACIAYAEGLLDALKYLDVIEF